MLTKLSAINGALRLLRKGALSASELANNSREPARVANAVWDSDFVRGCLEAGAWRFAIRTRQVIADPGIDPQFDGAGGFLYAYEKETDWLRTIGVYNDPSMQSAYSDYRDEAGYIFANVDTLYVSYISDDASFGGNLAIWPRSFQEYVEAKLAHEIAGPLTQEGADMMGLAELRLRKAIGKDVINESARRQPIGSWVRARFSGVTDDKQPNRF